MKRIFTFGYGQKNRGRFVIINGNNREDCRNKMIQSFGMEWAFVYDEYRLEAIKRSGLRELK